MRIIGGEFRSRRLLTPRDASTTRPIPDRVKESLFSLLRGHTPDATVFDAFAGTGAIGLEAVSRGAARCVFVERDRQIAEILRGNIAALGVEDRCDVVIGDALGPGALARCPRPVNLVFMDPPYPLVRDTLGWNRVRMQMERLIEFLADDGFAVLRTPWPHVLEPEPESGGEEPRGGRRTPELRAKRGDQSPDTDPRGSWRGRRRDRFGGDPDEPVDGIAGRGRRRKDVDKRKDAVEGSEEPQETGETADAEKASEAPNLPADLTISNAEGPETHVYHSMAVHLYVRKKTPQ
jgi:16S rRNA (guanine(966)-N(2))-methyltransferase RsmD